AGGLIVLAVLAAYHNSFSGPFVFDDTDSITKNPTISHLWPIWQALTPPHKVLSDSGLSVAGRPIVNLSLAVNYAVGGLAVQGYHGLNLAVHILASLVLFGVVRRTLLRQGYGGRSLVSRLVARKSEASDLRSEMLESTWLALAVALLWALHPLQTESVTYVVQRAESLMGLFYLLTLYCFIRGAEGRTEEARCQIPEASIQKQSGLRDPASARWLLASVFFCFLGMASKEVMVSAPLMVLLYDRTFVAGNFRTAWRQRWRLYLGLAATWLLLGYLVVGTQGRGGSAGFGAGITWWSYALTQFRAIVHYLRLSLWPSPLVFDYGTTLATQASAIVPYAAIVILLVAGTVFALWGRTEIGFLGAWFFAILAPSSSVVPVVTETMAEHRMYLPLAALVVWVVLGLYRLLGRRSAVIFLALAAGLGWATIQRNKVYRDEEALWSDTVAKCPGNARAFYNLGCALGERQDRLPEAIVAYETALRIDPNYALAHNNLGNALAQSGRLSDAIVQFVAALRIDPDCADAHTNFGNVLSSMPERLPDAIAQYEEALRIKPDFAEAHCNLGTALLSVPGRLSDARVEFETALRINPDLAQARAILDQLRNSGGPKGR
ncbi:MAG: tetratricopeptide repeat protein, partial [Opitutaceae bacterium]